MALFDRRPRELLYFPLTDDDFRAQKRRSYRLGSWIDDNIPGGAVFALLTVVIVPVLRPTQLQART